MKLEQIGNILCLVGVLSALLDSVRLRRRLKRYEAERAEAVARALGDGMVMVDEYTLPSPTDPRWTSEGGKTESGRDLPLIALGATAVTANDDQVYVRSSLPSPPLRPTAATVRYAQQVKTAYYNNTVRKSLEPRS